MHVVTCALHARIPGLCNDLVQSQDCAKLLHNSEIVCAISKLLRITLVFKSVVRITWARFLCHLERKEGLDIAVCIKSHSFYADINGPS